jgi:SSS family solute:Na+ symporter
MNRVGVVFLAALAAAIVVSLLVPPKEGTMQIRLDGVSYRTSVAFNIAAVGVILFLVAVYAIWW